LIDIFSNNLKDFYSYKNLLLHCTCKNHFLYDDIGFRRFRMASTLVQIRVDEKLKDDAAAVYEHLGLDLSTAVRIFFKRSVAENGIPFSMKLGNAEQNTLKRQIPQDVMAAMQMMTQSAALNGIDNMSLEEINNEINAVRKGQ